MRTGFGLRDVAEPYKRLSTFFLRLLDPDFREELTAVRQIEALGYSARDVRHVVLTTSTSIMRVGSTTFPRRRCT